MLLGNWFSRIVMPDTPEPYTVSRQVRLFRWLVRPAFRGLFHILSRVKVTGVENVPRQGAYLIVTNHISLYDPPFVTAFWPVAPEGVGAVDIWQRKGQSNLVRYYGGIPIHRGEYDRQVIEKLLAVLDSGRPLLISPEGGRSHKPGMRRAAPGVAFLAEKAGVPVVPVGVVGTTDDYLEHALHGKRPLLEMRIGASFRLDVAQDPGLARHTARQRNADRIMLQIAALLPPDYQGVYANDSILTA
jgi:1-acyl-sn-glycerol-3-phosphate acyltransferase